MIGDPNHRILTERRNQADWVGDSMASIGKWADLARDQPTAKAEVADEPVFLPTQATKSTFEQAIPSGLLWLLSETVQPINSYQLTNFDNEKSAMQPFTGQRLKPEDITIANQEAKMIINLGSPAMMWLETEEMMIRLLEARIKNRSQTPAAFLHHHQEVGWFNQYKKMESPTSQATKGMLGLTGQIDC